MGARLAGYLAEPFLARLYRLIREAGPVRSVSVDLTRICNLRCAGCYFFAEGMDQVADADEAALEDFIQRERKRGTTFVTVVGGEPSLAVDRLRRLYQSFRLSVATNGLVPIPQAGLEDLPIGVAVWGDPATDLALRGRPVFEVALDNYRGDSRAFFYYTVAPGHADQVEQVVARIVANGNRVLFNFYSDVEGRGGALDYRRGFGEVRDAIDRVISRWPEQVLISRYLAQVVSTGQLYDERWGHAVCTSVTPEHPANVQRVANGKPLNRHFRAYNADLTTTRRCCTGVDRSCESCFDTWEHFSWVMLNLKKHMGSHAEFSHWLTTMYLFYFINRLVEVEEGVSLLPEIHRRCAELAPVL